MKMNFMAHHIPVRHTGERYGEPLPPHREEEWRHAHLIPPHPVPPHGEDERRMPHHLPPHPPEGGQPPHPLPPHRRRRVYLEPDEEDFEIFVRIFGDEDSAAAALRIIQDAPPEISVIAMQIAEVLRRIEKC